MLEHQTLELENLIDNYFHCHNMENSNSQQDTSNPNKSKQTASTTDTNDLQTIKKFMKTQLKLLIDTVLHCCKSETLQICNTGCWQNIHQWLYSSTNTQRSHGGSSALDSWTLNFWPPYITANPSLHHHPAHTTSHRQAHYKARATQATHNLCIFFFICDLI